MNQDVYLLVDETLEPSERETFLRRFTAVNPHWRGAHVADVLSALADGDAHLRRTERALEDLTRTMPANWSPLFLPCALAVEYAESPQRSPEEYVKAVAALVKRVGPKFDAGHYDLAGRHD